jgi:lysophospholipase L1-like esterase
MRKRLGEPDAPMHHVAVNSRRIILAILPSLFALLIFGFGFFAGRYQVTRALRRQIQDYRKSETLGRIVPKGEKHEYALAYDDPASAERGMDRFSYAVPSVLTPFVGSGPEPGQHDNATINSMQFRSNRELIIPKPPDTYRIFLTGGSTAFGSGASSQNKTIGQFLENQLNLQFQAARMHCEVFTLASPAWTTTHERIAIENRLSELEPDMVISFSGCNDVHWAGAGFDTFWFRTYADQHFWDTLNTARRFAGASPMTDVVAPPITIDPSLVGARVEKNVRLSITALAFKNTRYVFVLQPALAIATKPLSAREKKLRGTLLPPALENFTKSYEAIRSRLSSIHDDHFLYLDQSDAFAGLRASDEIFLDSYHFGDRGNGIIATAIASGIRSHLVQPLR